MKIIRSPTWCNEAEFKLHRGLSSGKAETTKAARDARPFAVKVCLAYLGAVISNFKEPMPSTPHSTLSPG